MKIKGLFKNCTRRVIAIVTALVIVVSVFSGSLVFSLTASQEDCIKELKEAWSELYLSQTELFAIPRDGSSTKELSDAEKEAFGEYYHTGGTEYFFTYPEGQKSFTNYTGKEKVKFSFNYRVNSGSTQGKFELQFNYTNTKVITTSERDTFVKYENTGDDLIRKGNYRVNGIKIGNWHGAKLDVGCIYVSYEGNATLPEGCDDFSVREWIAAAKEVKLENVQGSSERFKKALEALEATVNVDSVIKEFEAEWKKLRVTKKELIGLPSEALRVSTADLSQKEQEILGDYYLLNTSGNTNTYVTPDGSPWHKNFSGKENVRYTIGYKLVLGDGPEKNFHITFQHIEGDYSSIWFNTTGLLTTATIKAEKLGGSKKDFFELKQIQIKNPNKHTLMIGGMYALYDVPVELPANSESFTAKDWITAAEYLDLSNCPDPSAFYEALSYLREFTAEGQAFNRLVSEWNKLIVNKTEVFAIPIEGVSTAELSEEERAAYGDYYKSIPFGGEVRYTYPENLDSFKNLSGYKNVNYFFTWKGATSQSTAKFELQVNGGNKQFPSTNSKDTLTKYSAPASTFSGGSAVTDIKVGAWQNQTALSVGCVFASYDAPADIPEDVEGMSIRELVAAAEKLDLSVFSEDVQKHFTAEVAAAKAAIEPISVDPEKVAAAKKELVSAWKELTYQDRVLWAIPPAAYRQETTPEAAASFDLKPEDLGPYYAKVDLKEVMLFYNSLDGVSSNFEEITDSVAIEINYSFLDENGNPKANVGGGKMDWQLNVTDSTWPNSWSHTARINCTDKKFTKYFDGTVKPSNVKIFYTGGDYSNVAVGCVYKIAVKSEPLPYGYENMELSALLSYAKELNLSKYDDEKDANRLANAITNAKIYSDSLIMARSEELVKAAEKIGVELDSSLSGEELVKAAMAADISAAAEKDEYLSALWQLRLTTKDGAAIENLKKVWSKTGKSLPADYAKLSVAEWIKAAEKIGSIANAGLKAQFASELRQLRSYLTGVADTTDLKKLVDKALTMDASNFVAATYSSFYNVVYEAQQVIKNPAGFSQTYADELYDKLLEAWDNLKYYTKTMYLDTNEYFSGDITKTATIGGAKDPRNTFVEFVKGIDLGPGFDCGAKVVNWSPADGVFNFGGKDLMPLNGYTALEFYVKIENPTYENDMINFNLQLMNKDGTEWFNYWMTVNSTQVKNGWIRFLIPIKNLKNGGSSGISQDVYMNENGFITRMGRFFINKGKADFTITNILALKENDATAGVVPTIPDVSVYRPPEKIKVIPKNPFDGVDRGDPWGDEYRLTLNKDTAPEVEKNEVDTDNKNDDKSDSSAPLYIIIIIAVAAVILAAAIILIILFMKKKKSQKQGG